MQQQQVVQQLERSRFIGPRARPRQWTRRRPSQLAYIIGTNRNWQTKPNQWTGRLCSAVPLTER